MVDDNALSLQLAPEGIRVTSLHVGYMDTEMVTAVTDPKADPAEIARIAVAGLEADLPEILADDTSRQLMAGLAGGVAATYPPWPETHAAGAVLASAV